MGGCATPKQKSHLLDNGHIQGAYQVSKIVWVSIRNQIDTIFEENRYHLDTKILLNRYQFSNIKLVHFICEQINLIHKEYFIDIEGMLSCSPIMEYSLYRCIWSALT